VVVVVVVVVDALVLIDYIVELFGDIIVPMISASFHNSMCPC
jgi:hypothetical protein